MQRGRRKLCHIQTAASMYGAIKVKTCEYIAQKSIILIAREIFGTDNAPRSGL
jgi:hypothetical protein